MSQEYAEHIKGAFNIEGYFMHGMKQELNCMLRGEIVFHAVNTDEELLAAYTIDPKTGKGGIVVTDAEPVIAERNDAAVITGYTHGHKHVFSGLIDSMLMDGRIMHMTITDSVPCGRQGSGNVKPGKKLYSLNVVFEKDRLTLREVV